MATIFQEKDLARKAIFERRNTLSPERMARKSNLICDKLRSAFKTLAQSSPEQQFIAAYSALPREVDLSTFLQTAFHAGARIAFPCMIETNQCHRNLQGSKQEMVFVEVSHQDWIERKLPFLESPARTLPSSFLSTEKLHVVSPELFTMAIIPLVGFDNNGNRLGYGGGNYDQFLPSLSQHCFTCGVAFEEQRLEAVPTESHDLSLPMVISA